LVVHLTSVRTNQTGADMDCRQINSNALPAWFERPKADDCDGNWTLDAASKTAAPSKPSSKLSHFKIPLRPMIGSIGVAPPWNASISAGDLGYHGGNLDYNRIVEGSTLHIPVFRAGALFSLGDGHAVQGDGEITGQGLETSLAVEFKVDLVKGKKTLFPWAEDAEYVMFSGIGNSMNEALQAATAGLHEYLTNEYRLGAGDIAQVLGSSIQYDVAEVVDPRPHVVAKLRKETLAMINK
jgi:amidase